MMPSSDTRSRQDRIAWAMLAVQAAVFGYLSKSIAYPAFVCALALPGVVTSHRITVAAERRLLGGLLLAVVFLMQLFVAPYLPPNTRVFLQYPLAHSVAQYFLTLQALQFLIRKPDERLTSAMPLFGTVVLICAADIYVSRIQSYVFQAAVISFVLLASVFYGTSRTFASRMSRPQRNVIRSSLAALSLVLTALIASGGCTLLTRHWADLERWFDPQRAATTFTGMGFGRQARLGNLELRKTQQAEAVALRVYAASEPGYLRGAAFDTYGRGVWDFKAPFRAVARVPVASPGAPAELSDVPVFSIREARSATWSQTQIWKDASVPADAMFLPIGTSLVDARAESLNVDDYDIAICNTANTPDSIAWVPADRPLAELTPAEQERLTQYPRGQRLDPEMRALVRQVFAGCRTVQEKVAAVESWFHQHYQYSLSVHVPRRTDPVRWFLLNRPPAHCEFFASGAAALLRMEGIPCRYVTGFVAREQNGVGKYWIARNRDAHAWVEAFVPERGWVTVEATPSEGVPARSQSGSLNSLYDELLLRIQMLRANWSRSDWRGLLRDAWLLVAGVLTSVPGLIFTVALTVWTSVLVTRSVRLRASSRLPPTAAARLLASMDRQLRRHALIRAPHETLHQFATRIRRAAIDRPELNLLASWYVDYARQRYGGGEPTA